MKTAKEISQLAVFRAEEQVEDLEQRLVKNCTYWRVVLLKAQGDKNNAESALKAGRKVLQAAREHLAFLKRVEGVLTDAESRVVETRLKADLKDSPYFDPSDPE